MTDLKSVVDTVGLGKRYCIARSNRFLDGTTKALFDSLGFVENRQSFDFAVFTGGEDICPVFYGQSKNSRTSYNLDRDMEEIKFFKGLPLKMPKIGICRGGQLLNIMYGGSMFQHVNNHAGTTHNVMDAVSGEIHVHNSVHHQMMIPADDARVLAWAEESTERWYEKNETKLPQGQTRPEIWEDPEVLFYDHGNALCFQGHPEYHHEPTKLHFIQLLQREFPKKD